MTDAPPSKGRGCFFYGCITAIVLFVVGSISIYLGVRYAIRSAIDEFTESSPITLPKVQISTADLAALEERVATFQKTLKDKKTGEPLVLTGNEINALIAEDSAFKNLRGKLYVTIEGDQIKGKISIPLRSLGFSSLEGRYLNGSAALKASLIQGVLVVNIQSLLVKGRDLPPNVLTQIRGSNLAQQFSQDPKNSQSIANFESITVEAGKLILKPNSPDRLSF